MSKILNPKNLVSASDTQPKLTLEQLKVKFGNEKEAMKIKCIHENRIVFTGMMKYQITDKIWALYQTYVNVPINNDMFKNTNNMFYIYPSKTMDFVSFQFNHYTDKNGTSNLRCPY